MSRTALHPLIDDETVPVERAAGDLRKGRPVLLDAAGRSHLIASTEAADDAMCAAMAELAGTPVALLVAVERARALGLSTAAAPILVRPPADAGAAWLRAAGYGPGDGLARSIGPAMVDGAFTGASDALAFAKHCRLLPSLIAAAVAPAALDRVCGLIERQALMRLTPAAIAAFLDRGTRTIARAGEAMVPLAVAEQSRFVVFRDPDGVREHVAVCIGNPAPGAPVLVRLHSACLTGDLFGSLRCDCGEQLQNAVAELYAAGGGVLLYLAQEGRGIGLSSKMRTYSLQDRGLDTIDSDQLLGFRADERRYEVAAAMLRDLGIDRVALMTNNPEKLAALSQAGITVETRIAVHGRVTAQNRRYLEAKAERAGHLLGEILLNGK